MTATTTVAARVPQELADAIRALAERQERKRTDLIADALMLYLARQEQAESLDGEGRTHANPAAGEQDGARGNRRNATAFILDRFRRAGMSGLTAPEVRELLPDQFDSNSAGKRVSELARRGLIAPLVTEEERRGKRYTSADVFGGVPRQPRDGETWHYDVPGPLLDDSVHAVVSQPVHTSITRDTRHGRAAVVYAITLAGERALREQS